MTQKENELAALRRESHSSHRGRIARDSRNRLKRIAAKKFRTCFISALAEFEDAFGLTLWGKGLSDNQLTPEQTINKVQWEHVRKNILDKGNAQSRALSMEIDLHKIEFEGYRMELGGIRDE